MDAPKNNSRHSPANLTKTAQYKVVREAMGEPDPIRLAYRDQGRELVRFVIKQRVRSDTSMLAQWATDAGIAVHDVPAFVDVVREELLDLHESALWRYRLTESEFRAWQQGTDAPR